MTKQHDIDYYKDGHVNVAFCKDCSAEGIRLTEDCPKKVLGTVEKPLDEKSQPSK